MAGGIVDQKKQNPTQQQDENEDMLTKKIAI
jgi:hypothetical protein